VLVPGSTVLNGTELRPETIRAGRQRAGLVIEDGRDGPRWELDGR